MIALYSPDLPPMPGGVSDHTLALARALERAGAPPVVLGNRGDPARIAPLTCLTGVAVRDLPQAVVATGALELVVQYVPFLYSRRGVAPGLSRALAGVAGAGAQVTLIVHEPFVPLTRLPWLVTGPLQRLQLRDMLKHSSRVLTPAPAFAEMIRRYAPKGCPITVAPSGAVLPVSGMSREEARSALGMESDRVAIGVFSPAASGFLHQWIAAATTRLSSHPRVSWVRFGFGSDRQLPGYPTCPGTMTLGSVATDEPGRIMRALDLSLSPYEDGLTLRRTGALLAIAHGVPTISSRGALFDPAAGELADCLPDATTFSERVAQLADDPTARRQLAGRTLRYSEIGSLDVTARLLLAPPVPGAAT